MGNQQNGYAKSASIANQQNNNFSEYVRKCCFEVHNGIVNKSAFDTIMEKLKTFNVIELSRTPLGDRLYQVLSIQSENRLTSDVLYQFIVSLDSNLEKRIEFTFKAIAYQGNNQISQITQRNFIVLIVDSFKYAFQLVVNQLPNEQKADGQLIEKWSQDCQQIQQITNAARVLFQNISQGNGKIEYNQFKKWVLLKQQETITVKFGSYQAIVPLTLIKFIN